MIAHDHSRKEGGHGHKFPAEKWDRLVSPQREAFLAPDRLLERFGVNEGMTVADLGAGPGFFTLWQLRAPAPVRRTSAPGPGTLAEELVPRCP